MLNYFWAFLVEFIGTFIFLYVIISTGQAIPIGLTLAAMLYLGLKISDGAFNPAVSTMLYYQGKIDLPRYIGYVFFQLLAGLCAYHFYSYFKENNIPDST